MKWQLTTKLSGPIRIQLDSSRFKQLSTMNSGLVERMAKTADGRSSWRSGALP